jgi:hypothetical protein
MALQNTNTADARQVALAQKQFILETNFRRGVNWFYWIGGLSIINSLIYLFGGSLTFVVGLGITQVVDAVTTGIAGNLSSNGETIIHIIGFIIDIALAGALAIVALLGQRKYRWAIIVGMIFYALDGVIFVLVGEWFAVFFHGFALWNLWRGLQSLNELNLLPQSVSSAADNLEIDIQTKQLVTPAEYLDLRGQPAVVSFLAMEYYAGILNRSYALIVTKNTICGAKVLGVVSSPMTASSAYEWKNPRNFISRKTRDKYRSIDPESPAFLNINRSNFQLPGSNIQGIGFTPRKKISMGGVPHSGSLFVQLTNGRKREFILLGNQEGEEIERRMLSACPLASRIPV